MLFTQEEFASYLGVSFSSVNRWERDRYEPTMKIKRKLNKTDLISSLRLLKRYNLIEITGDVTTSSCRLVILPTILMAIKSEDITEVFNTINKINASEEVK